MRSSTIIVGLVAMSLPGLAEADQPSEDDPDPVVQSFARELNREPAPAAPVRRDSVDEDRLYQAINPVHWTADEQTNTKSTDTKEKNDDEDENNIS